MDNQELQKWIERISLECFGRPFLHQASFNHRLRSTGGRYFIQSHNIEISWQQYVKHGRDEVEKIIKHELCHYHLHIMKRGYKHRDADFKQLLKQVGGSRFCKPLDNSEKRREPYRYKLICRSCGMEYLRKRKINLNKYACGKCRGRLNLFPLDFKMNS